MPWRPASPARPVGARAMSVLLRWRAYAAATVTAAVLLFVVGYILVRGVPNADALDLFAVGIHLRERLAAAGARPRRSSWRCWLVAAHGGARGRRSPPSTWWSTPAAAAASCAVVRMTAETLAGHPLHRLRPVRHAVLRDGPAAGAYSVFCPARCTLAIMVLPLIMRTTEEALMAVPDSYREGELRPGRRAGCARWLPRACCPRASARHSGRRHPGRRAACVGEAAALMFTAGTVAQIPTSAAGHLRPLRLLPHPGRAHVYALACEGLHVGRGLRHRRGAAGPRASAERRPCAWSAHKHRSAQEMTSF